MSNVEFEEDRIDSRRIQFVQERRRKTSFFERLGIEKKYVEHILITTVIICLLGSVIVFFKYVGFSSRHVPPPVYDSYKI